MRHTLPDGVSVNWFPLVGYNKFWSSIKLQGVDPVWKALTVVRGIGHEHVRNGISRYAEPRGQKGRR